MYICKLIHDKTAEIKSFFYLLLKIAVYGACSVGIFFLFEMFNAKTCSPCAPDSLCAVLLGGFLGSVVSSLITFLSLKSSTQQLQAQNQLTLREMFSEKRRWNIHLLLSRIYTCGRDEQDDHNDNLNNYEVSKLFSKEKRAEIMKNEGNGKLKKMLECELKRNNASLDDYLGIFEIAYKMLKKGTLDRDMFFTSYSYRIERFNACEYVHKKVYETECTYWSNIRKLIEENNVWKNDTTKK